MPGSSKSKPLAPSTLKRKRAVRRRHKSPKLLTQAQRSALIDRLEDATRAGQIDVLAIAPLYGAILHALFPEDFPAPRKASTPATSPPASAARMDDYAARAARREELFHSADVDAIANDRLALFARAMLNGRGVQVLGWEASEVLEEVEDEEYAAAA